MRQLLASLMVATSTTFLLQLVPAEGSMVDLPCNSSWLIHNYSFGAKNITDRLLYSDVVTCKGTSTGVISVNVCYPKQSGAPLLWHISSIDVFDLRFDGTGGCVKITNGGIDDSYVMLNFKTQKNHGMDFAVHIFGK